MTSSPASAPTRSRSYASRFASAGQAVSPPPSCTCMIGLSTEPSPSSRSTAAGVTSRPAAGLRGEAPYAGVRSETAATAGTTYTSPPIGRQNSDSAATGVGRVRAAARFAAPADRHIADLQRSPGASRERGRSSLRPVRRTYSRRRIEVKALRTIGCVRARWRYVGDEAFRVGSTTAVGFQPSTCRPGPGHLPACQARGDRFTMPPSYWRCVNKRHGDGRRGPNCAQDHPEGVRP